MSIFLLWLVATFNFFIFSLAEGEPAAYLLHQDIDFDKRLMILQSYGHYDPWPIKYLKYLRNMFTFGIIPPHFGWSTLNNQFVTDGLYWRLPITLLLLGTTLVGSMILGIPIGVFAASKRGTKTDIAAVGSALLTYGFPTFFIQLLAILFFGKVLWETYGIKIVSPIFSVPAFVPHDLVWWFQVAGQLTLPILTLVITGFGYWVLMTRNLLIDALTQDYVATARAKGLSERAVLYKHTFKSILPPICTMISLAIPALITGSIITETVFNIEGIGRYFIRSFMTSSGIKITIIDSAVAQAVFFIFAALAILCNLIADILYGALDPRIRVGTER